MGNGNGASTVKLYYRIGEVAGIVGVEPHVLRYWETEFPTIRPQKSRSGQRVYSRKDVDKLLRVKELLYAQRFTIAGARQRLRDGATDIASAAGSLPQPNLAGQEARGDLSTDKTLDNGLEVEATHPFAPDSGPQDNVHQGPSVAALGLRSALMEIRVEVVRLLESLSARDFLSITGSSCESQVDNGGPSRVHSGTGERLAADENCTRHATASREAYRLTAADSDGA